MINPISVTWSDYDGDEVYGDFEMIGGVATDLRSLELGMGKFAWSGGVPDTGSVQFYHGDQIGTTRLMTDSSGTGTLPVVHTAFGERVNGTQHRYGYAGAWGYQAPSGDDPDDPYLDFPFLHVGARYYDPATGRFLQRDPIGIAGALNVYGYVAAVPSANVDPDGEFAIFLIAAFLVLIIAEVAEAPGPADTAEEFAAHREAQHRSNVVMSRMLLTCQVGVTWRAARLGWRAFNKLPSPNPPPYVSPFPPMPTGPFHGGGQLWPPL